MHPNLTMHRLNEEAAEAAKIISAADPGRNYARSVAGVTNYPVGELKSRAAHSQETIARITGAARG